MVQGFLFGVLYSTKHKIQHPWLQKLLKTPLCYPSTAVLLFCLCFDWLSGSHHDPLTLPPWFHYIWIAITRPLWVFATLCLLLDLVLAKSMHMSRELLQLWSIILLARGAPVGAAIQLAIYKFYVNTDYMNKNGMVVTLLHELIHATFLLLPAMVGVGILLFLINPMKITAQTLLYR